MFSCQAAPYGVRRASRRRATLAGGCCACVRTILDVPKPRYGGVPNLCEDIY